MKTKLGFAALVAGLALAITAPSTAHAQSKTKKGPGESHAVKSRGTGADANIKSDAEIKNKAGDNGMAAPAQKGGAKTRGANVGQLHIDNRTGWYIRLYVDGELRGTISPYGDSYFWGGCDTYRLYAVAPFDDGSSYSFGPVQTSGDCDNQTWTLRR
jgi:hypothetical protein